MKKPIAPTIEQLLERVNTIVQEYGVQEVHEEEGSFENKQEFLFVPITIGQLNDDLTELGLDSISFIRLIVSIEEEYDIEFEDENLLLSNMNTIKKIFDVVQKLMKF